MALRAKIEAYIANEAKNEKIYSYSAIELKQDIIEQCQTIDSSLSIVGGQLEDEKLSFDELVQLRDSLKRK